MQPGDGKGAAAPRVELAYPLRYTFKIIGLASDDFAEHARRIVARVVGFAAPEDVRVRASSGGKYHAVSVVVMLGSEAQRRGIYEALHADERVVYYL